MLCRASDDDRNGMAYRGHREIVDDTADFLRRIVLTIEWDRVADAKPISMVAWLPTKKQDGQLTNKNGARGTP